MTEIIHAQESYKIIGACFEVYKEKGCGFLESVFQECLQLELGMQGINSEAQKPITLRYKGHPLVQTYKADLICYGNVLVELKAVIRTDG